MRSLGWRASRNDLTEEAAVIDVQGELRYLFLQVPVDLPQKPLDVRGTLVYAPREEVLAHLRREEDRNGCASRCCPSTTSRWSSPSDTVTTGAEEVPGSDSRLIAAVEVLEELAVACSSHRYSRRCSWNAEPEFL